QYQKQQIDKRNVHAERRAQSGKKIPDAIERTDKQLNQRAQHGAGLLAQPVEKVFHYFTKPALIQYDPLHDSERSNHLPAFEIVKHGRRQNASRGSLPSSRRYK